MNATVCGRVGPVPTDYHRAQRRKYQRYTKVTYIGLLAYVIQDSPKKMLTFKQIMGKVGVFISGDRRGLENNIRVCLSSNKCFVKVPVDPEYPNAKRNFWKVDESCITPKMLRRHFSDMADMFPGLVPKWSQHTNTIDENIENPSEASTDHLKISLAKFSGPFSIESLLKKDPTDRRVKSDSAGQMLTHDALTRETKSNVSGSEKCYKTKDNLYCSDRGYQQPNLTRQYIYSPAGGAVVSGVWNPAQKTHVSAQHHSLGLLNTPQLYESPVLSKFSVPHPYTYGLRFLTW